MAALSDIDFNNLNTRDMFGGGSSYGKVSIPKDPGMSMPNWDKPVSGGSVFGGGGGYNPVTGGGVYSGGGGGDLPSGYDPVSGKTGSGSSVWDSLQNVLGSVSGGGTNSGTGTNSSVGQWLQQFAFGNPGDGFLSGLGPYAAVAGFGINQVKNAQEDAKKYAGQMSDLGKPYLDAGKQLLTNYQNNTLRPEQQQFVDLSNKFGDQMIQSTTPLGQIAQQAFADYNSGKLNAADEMRLKNQLAAQKQAVRQRLSSMGITDSSVLLAQDQQIDNQGLMARQDLLDKRFATGNQAYDQWLKGTQEGQQLKLRGQQFATSAFEEMLTNSLNLASEGMQPAMQAIQLRIQSDAELSQTMSDLLGNLAAAYSYAMAGPGNAAGGGGGGGQQQGGGGGGGNLIGNIIDFGKDIWGGIKDIFNFDGAGGQAAKVAGGVGDLLGGAAGAYGLFKGIKNKDPASAFSGAGALASTLGKSALTSGTALGSAAASVAGPLGLAGVGFAATKLINNALGVGKKGAEMGALKEALSSQDVYYGKTMFGQRMPDGKVVSNEDFKKMTELWLDGDQEGYAAYLANAKDYRNDKRIKG